MKSKLKLVLILLTVFLAGGAVWVADRGISIGDVEIGGSERQWLSTKTYDFLEDLQFKDFQKASTYHLKADQVARDIPALIQRVFVVKHEVLDIMRFEIIEVDLDRSGTRARVRANVWFRALGDSDFTKKKGTRRKIELLFYWFRDSIATPPTWTMELSSSLK